LQLQTVVVSLNTTSYQQSGLLHNSDSLSMKKNPGKKFKFQKKNFSHCVQTVLYMQPHELFCHCTRCASTWATTQGRSFLVSSILWISFSKPPNNHCLVGNIVVST